MRVRHHDRRARVRRPVPGRAGVDPPGPDGRPAVVHDVGRVDDAGPDHRQFNEAFAVGWAHGQDIESASGCTWKTVELLTGVRLDGLVLVDFVGLRDMVDAIGGVPICLPTDLERRGHRARRLRRRAGVRRHDRRAVRPGPARHRRRLRHRPDHPPARPDGRDDPLGAQPGGAHEPRRRCCGSRRRRRAP